MCFLSSGGLDLLNDPSDASSLPLCSHCFSRRRMKLAKRRRRELICQKVTKVKAEEGWDEAGLLSVRSDKLSQRLTKVLMMILMKCSAFKM